MIITKICRHIHCSTIKTNAVCCVWGGGIILAKYGALGAVVFLLFVWSDWWLFLAFVIYKFRDYKLHVMSVNRRTIDHVFKAFNGANRGTKWEKFRTCPPLSTSTLRSRSPPSCSHKLELGVIGSHSNRIEIPGLNVLAFAHSNLDPHGDPGQIQRSVKNRDDRDQGMR